jgi:hypothetical protein
LHLDILSHKSVKKNQRISPRISPRITRISG